MYVCLCIYSYSYMYVYVQIVIFYNFCIYICVYIYICIYFCPGNQLARHFAEVFWVWGKCTNGLQWFAIVLQRFGTVLQWFGIISQRRNHFSNGFCNGGVTFTTALQWPRQVFLESTQCYRIQPSLQACR